MAQQQTRAITVAGKAQEALDQAPIDPRLLMAAKAIQLMAGQDDEGYPKISADMALAAAMYQAGTGQMLGRDFYLNDKQGRMEGYRGVARDANERGVGEVQIKYRSLTAQEAEDNEVKPGDVAVACEVYQLRAWEKCQRLGIRYEPVVGIGILWAREKVNQYGKPIFLAGGMTWRKKAQNRAYKDALRHTPGMPASPEEVIADAATSLDELPPETARLTMEQAQAWVEQHGVSGDDEPDGVVEGQYVEQPKPQPANGQQAQAAAMNGDTFAFNTPKTAVEWAMKHAPEVWPVDSQGYIVRDVVVSSLKKLQDQGLTGKPLAIAWVAKVEDKIETWKRSQTTEQPAAATDPDGWHDVDSHGHDAEQAPF